LNSAATDYNHQLVHGGCDALFFEEAYRYRVALERLGREGIHLR
jgi:hypothetical protein